MFSVSQATTLIRPATMLLTSMSSVTLPSGNWMGSGMSLLRVTEPMSLSSGRVMNLMSFILFCIILNITINVTMRNRLEGF